MRLVARRNDLPDFDGRPTVRFVNTTPDHPKVVGLSDKAFRVWFDSVCYCSVHETNGDITKPMMRKITTPKVIAELVAAKLLEDHDEKYVVHDYLLHNRAAEEIQSYREARADAGALGAHKRWHVPNRKFVKECEYCLKEVASA